MKNKEAQKELGPHLRVIRKKKGLTQEELADRCGLHWTYIGGLERGERNPTLSTMQKIANGLAVNLYEFFDRRHLAAAPGIREKKEGKLMTILRREDDRTLDLATGVLREVLTWQDRHKAKKHT